MKTVMEQRTRYEWVLKNLEPTHVSARASLVFHDTYSTLQQRAIPLIIVSSLHSVIALSKSLAKRTSCTMLLQTHVLHNICLQPPKPVPHSQHLFTRSLTIQALGGTSSEAVRAYNMSTSPTRRRSPSPVRSSLILQ